LRYYSSSAMGIYSWGMILKGSWKIMRLK